MITEDLIYSKYAVISQQKSTLAKKDTIRVETGVTCPACQKKNKSLSHGQKETCSCGLSFCRMGNTLRISK